LSAAKSRFVANVSHELRTPLTGVFAVYDLLRRRRLAPDEKELVGSLGSAITTLKASVDAVLQMSKLEAGAERAEARLFNLRYFLWQVDALVRPQAEAKRLAWSLDLHPHLPAAISGDPSHLQHVLGNLVNNALKFTPKGGVTLRVEPSAAGVRFEVVDTGIGIPLEKQETLFERFVRVDESATRRYGGTGLGTSIAHDLVMLMGGSIGVHSAPGKGSTFWVELPLMPPTADTVRPDWEVTRREVLVVGHDQPERDAVLRSLVTIGLNPVVAATVAQQPPPFDPERYVAALLVLPVSEAAAYADQLLRDRAGHICPWFVVTNITTPTQAGALLGSGAAALLTPNITPDELHTQLAALVHRGSVAPDNEPAPVTTNSRAFNVLLADDNRSNQLLLARILADAGHTVRMAERGDEAYDLLAAGGFDIAILDLNMPEMSGPDVIKLYRAGEIGTGNRLPLIILSADATPTAQEESLEAGANEFLTKPVTGANLVATIERVMAGAKLRQVRQTASADKSAPPSERVAMPPVNAVATLPVEVAPSDAPARPLREPATLMLVDSDRIEALRRIANHDQNFLQRYTAATFDDLDAAVAELGQAVAAGNMRMARDALHKIDGTSANIGAIALAASAKSMRNYLSVAPDSDAAAALAELATTSALTKSAVSALLQEGRIPNRNPR
jgi:two-component system sensor histidine kinase RpfC